MAWDASRAMAQFYSNNIIADNMTARNGHGTPYPVDSKELRILQDPLFGPGSRGFRTNPPRISLQQAYERLCTYQRPDAKSNNRWKALREAMKCEKLTWDLIIKMFDDIDACFFNGDLRRRVYLRWRPFDGEEEIAIGVTMSACAWENRKRVSISLRTNHKWEAVPKTSVLGTLVHEMVHAYFLIHCGELGSLEFGCMDPSHGTVFTAAANMLERLTSLDLTTDSIMNSMLKESPATGPNGRGTMDMMPQHGYGYGPQVAWPGMWF
ncbi:uncharacterized protein MYCFIDRAFT_78127 [Pseudocercospora fijiensis CIRAD86]|uniref:Uncharacterized protein n=1 Tax=Pseudocercospora fijiensis (strain CIRAD86) TaxID=383855 RepID=M2YRN6_PSEFD|nr:uncharacterized protein MYCFIDRAFT_78127 [Pseudocercospora fijiensis CIRAD86]EME80385.1 hypothetical protein MYCFIDRAFT_78127 [Pseudocercospora fijiensis CIRAD86]